MSLSGAGTPVLTSVTANPSTTGVQAVFGTGQGTTAGNLLVAVTMATGTTSVSTTTLKTGTTGWTKVLDVAGAFGSGYRARVTYWTKVATGSDTAPFFVNTISGTITFRATTVELHSSTGATILPYLFGTGVLDSVTGSTQAVTSNGSVPASGMYAICAKARERASVTSTYTPGSGWTAAVSTSGTATTGHAAVDILAGPASGSALSDSATWSSTATSSFGGAGMVVFGEQVSGQTTVLAQGSGTPIVGGAHIRVKVLTGAKTAAGQTSTPVSNQSGSTYQASITTTAAGSIVYGSVIDDSSITANASSALLSSHAGSAGTQFASLRQTTPTGTPGAETIGATAAGPDGGVSLMEILSSAGTITEDASEPDSTGTVTTAGQSSATDISVSSSPFTPPGGSLLVAMAANMAAGATLTDTLGLTWTELGKISVDGYAAVWIADVPGGSSPASGSGSITFAGTAAAAAPAASGGSLAISGTSAARAPAAASGSLSLAGTAAAAAPITAAGSLTVAGTAAAAAPAAAAGTVTISGTGAAAAPAAASGSVTVAGTATAAGPGATAAGALAIAGTAAARAPAAAAGSLTLNGTAAAAAPAAAAGSLAITGAATAKAPAAASGALVLSGTAAAVASAAAAGSVALNGTASATGPGTTASGSLALAGTAAAQAAAAAAGTVTLTGSATARAPAAAAGLLAITGTAAARAPAAAAGVITLTGSATGGGPPPPFTVGSLTASGAPSAVLTAQGASGALTAATAPSGTLTAGTQSTGGPQ